MIRAAQRAFGCHDPAGDSHSRRPQIKRRHLAVTPCPLPVNNSSPSLSPERDPWMAARRPPAPVRPSRRCQRAESKLGSATAGHFRPPRCRWNAERKPGAAGRGHFRSPATARARGPRLAPRAEPFHALPSSPDLGATLRRARSGLSIPIHGVGLGAVLPLLVPATEARGKSGSVAVIQGVSSE
jgi:hypothetical protein